MRPFAVSSGGGSPNPTMQLLGVSLAIRCVIRAASPGRTVIAFYELKFHLVLPLASVTCNWSSYRPVVVSNGGASHSPMIQRLTFSFCLPRCGSAAEPVRLTKGQRAQKAQHHCIRDGKRNYSYTDFYSYAGYDLVP